MFQFQTGSIKRQRSPHARNRRSQFQFQTGSIKSTYAHLGKITKNLFQFQTGSIKSTASPVSGSETITGFNSKLVRLKVHLVILGEYDGVCFNSKLVRLKVNSSSE